MTRPSCHRFRGNEVRLWLSILACNLGNLWRRLALPAHLRLVPHQPAAAVGEDGRTTGKACAVLQADAGGWTPDESTVRGDVAQDRVVAASGKLDDWRHTRRIGPFRTKENGKVSEKSARNEIDDVGETRRHGIAGSFDCKCNFGLAISLGSGTIQAHRTPKGESR